MHERIIQAAIVNHERTHVLLHGESGELPELTFAAEHGTVEGTLQQLGRTVLRNVSYVSVDYGYAHEGKTLYQTKPVPETAVPAEPYAWGACPDSIALR